MDYQNLMDRAKEISNNAYSKYSHFSVGACVLCKDGKYYEGCNLKTQAMDYQSAQKEMQSEAPLQQVKKKFLPWRFILLIVTTVFRAEHACRLFQNSHLKMVLILLLRAKMI